jgi:hypothetical protein
VGFWVDAEGVLGVFGSWGARGERGVCGVYKIVTYFDVLSIDENVGMG